MSISYFFSKEKARNFAVQLLNYFATFVYAETSSAKEKQLNAVLLKY